MIDDNTKMADILRLMDTERHAFFLFDPEKAHYTNSMSIYRAIKKRWYERFYGEKIPSVTDGKKIKNAFRNCKTPLEIFHRERNVKQNISQQIGRIGYMVDKGYQLNILGNNKPEIKNLEKFINEKADSFDSANSYKKPDFFLPVNTLHGLINSQEWQKNGIEILMLNNRLIYPYYGVWSPTSQEYLTLVNLFMKGLKDPHKMKNSIDLGSGTGILSIMAVENGIGGEIIALDNYENAVE